MKKRMIALALVLALVVTGLVGCKNFGGDPHGMTEGSQKEKDSKKETSKEAETTEAETTEEYTYPGADKTEFTTQDFSDGFDDNGFITGIRALDYMTLPDLKSIKIAKADVDPTDEEIQQSIKSILSKFRTKNMQREVEDGDQVSIDFKGSYKGEFFEGGSATDAEVTAGSEDFVDDFLTQIIGHVPGDVFDITVTFPESYPKNETLAGQDVQFNITINYVYDIPELTDEWFAENKDALILYVGEDIEDADGLREFVRKNLLNSAVFDLARTEILNNWTLEEMPDPAFGAALNMTRASLYVNYQISLDQYAQALGMSDETVGNLIYQDAIMLLVHQAIAETEDWNVTDEDYVVVTGMNDNSAFIERYGRGYLSQYVLSIWAQDYIAENVTVE